MSLPPKNRQGEGPLRNQTFALSIAVAVLLAVGSVTYSPAQLPKLPKPPDNPPAKASLDPLGRDTPRSAMIGFLKYESSGDFDTAARFLQLPRAST